MCVQGTDAGNAGLKVADDKAALSQQQREEMEAQISSDMLAIERAECALIWHAEANGEVIDFRSDTSPVAVLGVRLITAPRARHRERRRSMRSTSSAWGDEHDRAAWGCCLHSPAVRQGGTPRWRRCAARPIAPARLPIAPGPPAVSVRSVEAGGPRFLDCLPTIVDRIIAVGGIVAAVIRAGVVAAVVRAAIIAICAARDRATD
jgi:hypothetical protein